MDDCTKAMDALKITGMNAKAPDTFGMNAEQLLAFEHFKKGHNIFLTGPAGTGKSYTLKEMKKWAYEQKKNIGITATTGSSAILIGGRTIHSFLGIGLGKKSASELAAWVTKKFPKVVSKLVALDVLVIEEISMMDAEFFDKVSAFLSILRKNDAPFGGLQLVSLGDFTQLGPVHGEYCFKAAAWPALNMTTIVLKQLMRQKDDTEFQDILNEVRWGKCSKRTLARLRKLKATTFGSGVKPTILFAKNVDVDTINETKFKELVAAGAHTCNYKTSYSSDGAKTWGTMGKIPESVGLCIGAQVVCTWNISLDEGIVNGTRGVVKEFRASGVLIELKSGKEFLIPPVTVKDEDSRNTWMQFMPLKLAWCLTIHKSQGMTLDAVVLSLGDVYNYGQGYTALSRVRDLNSVRILDVEASSFRAHPDVIAFYA